MRFYKNSLILTILFSMALFVAGLCTFHLLCNLFLPKAEGGFFQPMKYGDDFIATIIFSCIIGLIPFLMIQTWRLSPVVSRSKKAASVLVVILSMTLALLLRQQILTSYARSQAKSFNSAVDKVKLTYPLEQLNFEYYLAGGLIAGCFISGLLLRKK